MGSHAFGFNHLSIGLCLIGGREEGSDDPSDNFTPIQRGVLIKYCAGFLTEFPDAQICGHSELMKWKSKRGSVSKTAHSCPALDVNQVRLEAMAFKFPDNPTRTLTEMLNGHTIREHVLHNASQATAEAKPDEPHAAGQARPRLHDGAG